MTEGQPCNQCGLLLCDEDEGDMCNNCWRRIENAARALAAFAADEEGD